MNRSFKILASALTAAALFGAAAIVIAADAPTQTPQKPCCEKIQPPDAPKAPGQAPSATDTGASKAAPSPAIEAAQKKLNEIDDKIDKAIASDATTIGQLKALRLERRKAVSEFRETVRDESEEMAEFIAEAFRVRGARMKGGDRGAWKAAGCGDCGPDFRGFGPCGCDGQGYGRGRDGSWQPPCGQQPGDNQSDCRGPCGDNLRRPAMGDCGPRR